MSQAIGKENTTCMNPLGNTGSDVGTVSPSAESLTSDHKPHCMQCQNMLLDYAWPNTGNSVSGQSLYRCSLNIS